MGVYGESGIQEHRANRSYIILDFVNQNHFFFAREMYFLSGNMCVVNSHQGSLTRFSLRMGNQ